MKNTSLYLIQFSDGIKIGISSNLKVRVINAYKSAWCKPIKYGIVFHNLAFPMKIETQMKFLFKQFKAEGSTEYFQGVSFRTLLKRLIRLIKKMEKEVKQIKFGKHNVLRSLNYERINFNFPEVKTISIGYNY